MPITGGPPTRDLELAEDIRLERRTWRAERIGWLVMAVVLVAGAAGLLGSAGPLTRASGDAGGGALHVSYDRFLRFGTTTELELVFQPSLIRDGEVRLWLANAYTDRMMIEAIMPSPARVESAAGRTIYSLHTTGGSPASVRISLGPEAYGRVTAQIGVEDGPSVGISQFVLP